MDILPLLFILIGSVDGIIAFLFLDDGKGFRIVQNGSRQERMGST